MPPLNRLRHLPYGLMLAFALTWMVTIPLPDFARLNTSLSEVDVTDLAIMTVAALIALVFPSQIETLLHGRRGIAFLCLAATGAYSSTLILAGNVIETGFNNELELAFCFIVAAYQVFLLIGCLLRLTHLSFFDCILSLAFWQLFVGIVRIVQLFAPYQPLNIASIIAAAALVIHFDQTIGKNYRTFNRATAETRIPATEAPIQNPESDEAGSDPRQTPYRLFALYGLVVFTIYLLHYLSNSNVIEYSFVGAFAAAVLIMITALRSKRLIPLRRLYGLAVAFLEVSIVVFAFGTLTGFALSAMALDAAYVMFSAFFFAVFCNVCQRGNVLPMRLFALVYLVEYIAAMAGIIVALRLVGQGVVVVLVLLAATSSLMFGWLSSESDFRTAWGTASPERSYIDPARYFQDLSVICTTITMQYSLSPREADVLLYLAQQKTAPQIAEALCVSTSTVKTHTNSIYKKLNVHSRKELHEFIGLPHPESR